MSDADFQDHYRILGVSPTASGDDISAAYLALAVKYHPDISERDDESRLFKEVSRAYQVLSDPKQRRRYDQRITRRHSRSPPDFAGLSSSRRQVIEADLPVTPEEARYGAVVCVTLNLPQSCRACDGKGVQQDTPCQLCNGTGSTRAKHRLDIVIAPGTRHGAVLRVNWTQQTIQLRIRIQPCW